MTPNASWLNWGRHAIVLALATALAAAWLWLAALLFVFILHLPLATASPLILYRYWYYLRDVAAVSHGLSVSLSAAALLVLLPAARLVRPARRALYGDARFATQRQIRQAGLFSGAGIVVGRLGREYLTFPGEQHVILSAPTRSGKGAGVVVPNLLTWPHSAVVLDIKHENWERTSGFRSKHGQACYLFDPASTGRRTHRYNPLAYIADDPNTRIDDIQKIANLLFPDRTGTDTIWTATPRSLFLGIVLYLLETSGKLVTMGQVLRETLIEGDGAAYFTRVIHERAQGTGGIPLTPTCVRALNTYISIAADSTRAGVMTSFRSRLELWMNPIVDAATSTNDFDLRDVRKKRMSIYLGITPNNIDRMAPLVNLLIQQLVDLNTRALPGQDPDIRMPCLLVLDEFAAFGKLPVLAKGVSYLAGYWLRLLCIVQSPAQIVDIYGKEAAQTFTTNHALQIVFAPKASETATARDISEWLGYQTVKGRSESRSIAWFERKSRNETMSDQKRALLLPQEITALGKHAALIIAEDCPPILARKIRYFEDSDFRSRLLPAADVPQLLILPPAADSGLPFAETGRSSSSGTVPKKSAPSVQLAPPEGVPLSPTNMALSVHWKDIPVPPPDCMDIEVLHAYADELCRQCGIEC